MKIILDFYNGDEDDCQDDDYDFMVTGLHPTMEEHNERVFHEDDDREDEKDDDDDEPGAGVVRCLVPIRSVIPGFS